MASRSRMRTVRRGPDDHGFAKYKVDAETRVELTTPARFLIEESMETSMNTKQTFSPETLAANRLGIQLAWWFPAATDGGEDLDQRLRAGRAFVTDVHAAMQAVAGRLRETILAANERIATELAKVAASQQPVDVIAARGEIGKALLEAAAANAATWKELWLTVCECATRSAEAPQSRPAAGTKAAKPPPVPGRRQTVESSVPLVGAS